MSKYISKCIHEADSVLRIWLQASTHLWNPTFYCRVYLYHEADVSSPVQNYKDSDLITYMRDIRVGWACSKDVLQQKHKTNSGRKSQK
jgi:hypothetical protein